VFLDLTSVVAKAGIASAPIFGSTERNNMSVNCAAALKVILSYKPCCKNNEYYNE
jgi:hypothetical protein